MSQAPLVNVRAGPAPMTVCALSLLGFDYPSNNYAQRLFARYQRSVPTGTRAGSPNQVPQSRIEVDHVHHPCRYITRPAGLVMYG